MSNARVGIKVYKTASEAGRQSAHIMREHGSINGNEPNIIPIMMPKPNVFHIDKMNTKERRKLQKKEQQFKSRAKKYQVQGKEELAQKNLAYAEEIRLLLNESQVNRKGQIQFVELELVITEFKPSKEWGVWISKISSKYVKQFFGTDVEMISGAVHLDQRSLHAHMMIKPNRSWRSICDDIGGKKDAYYQLTQSWHNFIEKKIYNQPTSLKLNPLTRGTSKDYTELPLFKQIKAIEKKVKNQELETAQKHAEVQELKIKLEKREQELANKHTEAIRMHKEVKDIRDQLSSMLGEITDLNTLKIKAFTFVEELKNSLFDKAKEMQKMGNEMSDVEFKRAYSDRFTDQEILTLFPKHGTSR